MKSYEAYLFDLYGTLIDIHTDESSLSFWKKARVIFSVYGARYEAKELKESYFSIIGEQEKKHAKAGHQIEIDIAEVFKELFRRKGIESDMNQIKEVAWRFRQASTSHLRLYAGTTELLQVLRSKGKKIYLLSNAQSLFTMPELQMLGIRDLFDDIVISSDVGYRKPDPEIFGYLLEKHGLSKENCLMIGNDLSADVKGAASAGIDSYYIHSDLFSHDRSDVEPAYRQNKMNLRFLLRKILN